MNKLFIPMLLILTLAAGCNLPNNPRATPTADMVATQVATLQRQESLLTPIVLAPEMTATPTAAVTKTTTPTAAPSPTATSTASANDPRVQLGTPTGTDTLDNGKSFGLDSKAYDDENTYIRVENGAMVLTSRYAIGYKGWRTGGTKLGNAYVEATIRVGECSGGDTYGLAFRSPDFNKGYWFQVTCSGNWNFGYWDGSEYSSLGSGTNTSDALLTGSNQVNRLGAWASGNQIKLYINGKMITQLEDSSQTEPGSFGAIIASFNTPNFTIYVNEFSWWKLD